MKSKTGIKKGQTQPKNKPVKKPELDANLTSDDIAAYLATLKFRKKLLGGVDEYDVWKKIKFIDEMYQCVSKNQEAGFNALLNERNDMLRKMTKSSARNSTQDGTLAKDKADEE